MKMLRCWHSILVSVTRVLREMFRNCQFFSLSLYPTVTLYLLTVVMLWLSSSLLQERAVHWARWDGVLPHAEGLPRSAAEEDDSAQVFPQLHVWTSVEGSCQTRDIGSLTYWLCCKYCLRYSVRTCKCCRGRSLNMVSLIIHWCQHHQSTTKLGSQDQKLESMLGARPNNWDRQDQHWRS